MGPSNVQMEAKKAWLCDDHVWHESMTTISLCQPATQSLAAFALKYAPLNVFTCQNAPAFTTSLSSLRLAQEGSKLGKYTF